ncbi:MAG: SDR family oxidoreductase [Parvularculaceae bacterium]|nr:SDR family oxidoreductase [Parvularculaceae bacterium]
MTQRAVLVTGGGKRVGKAIVEAAAASGWLPIVHYNSSGGAAEAVAEANGGVAVQEDLSQPGAGTRLMAKATELVSTPIAGLVNSASIFEHDVAQNTTEDALLRNFQIHTVAPVMMAQAFAAQAPDRSVVVNILDQKLFNLNPDHFAYTISKQALHGATMTLAHALAPKVRVVGVAPGYNLPSPGQPQEVFDRLAPTVNVLERRLETEDVADTVLFALNNKAITGQVLMADNGEHLKASARDVIFSE